MPPESCGSCALLGWIDRKRDGRKDGTAKIRHPEREQKKFHIKNALLCVCNAVFRKKLKKIAYPALKTLAYSNNITNFVTEMRQ